MLRELLRSIGFLRRVPRTNASPSDLQVPVLPLGELSLNVAVLDAQLLLHDWQWFVLTSMRPALVSRIGDIFLLAGDGSVHHLDTCGGTLRRVATDLRSFERELQRDDRRREWLFADIVALKRLDGVLASGNQCYSWVHPPVLGGSFDPANLEVTDIYVHSSIMGQIHRQVRGLSPGTPISEVRIGGV